ncbi:MAG: hypothetical protein P9L90_00295 [Candidatus Aadella gelida]|nr:hypothetical protein [Candidatus Aadella gelida]
MDTIQEKELKEKEQNRRLSYNLSRIRKNDGNENIKRYIGCFRDN